MKHKIDWPNHIIGFLSALFGILIAFQLDDWRENRSQRQLAREALKIVRNETSLNKNILLENTRQNERSLQSLRSVVPFISEELYFLGTFDAADSINKSNSYVRILIPEKKTVFKKTAYEVHLAIDRIEVSEIHTSAWESAKATGALNYMSLENVDMLSLLYNNTKLRDHLSDLRQAIKKADFVKTKTDLATLLQELEKVNDLVKREVQKFESYTSILENME